MADRTLLLELEDVVDDAAVPLLLQIADAVYAVDEAVVDVVGPDPVHLPCHGPLHVVEPVHPAVCPGRVVSSEVHLQDRLSAPPLQRLAESLEGHRVPRGEVEVVDARIQGHPHGPDGLLDARRAVGARAHPYDADLVAGPRDGPVPHLRHLRPPASMRSRSSRWGCLSPGGKPPRTCRSLCRMRGASPRGGRQGPWGRGIPLR